MLISIKQFSLSVEFKFHSIQNHDYITFLVKYLRFNFGLINEHFNFLVV